ncbi:hypothetical protein JTB14_022385 [Gonioctena quinquepunctata]|nr:hypothetical protein JTB14_022385 [Gonioctena quinquepunctata]
MFQYYTTSPGPVGISTHADTSRPIPPSPGRYLEAPPTPGNATPSLKILNYMKRMNEGKWRPPSRESVCVYMGQDDQESVPESRQEGEVPESFPEEVIPVPGGVEPGQLDRGCGHRTGAENS